MKKLVQSQFVILLLGTLFAWGNFIRELVAWLNEKSNAVSCSQGANPFFTPSFYGAIFFTLAFIVSSIMLKKSK